MATEEEKSLEAYKKLGEAMGKTGPALDLFIKIMAKTTVTLKELDNEWSDVTFAVKKNLNQVGGTVLLGFGKNLYTASMEALKSGDAIAAAGQLMQSNINTLANSAQIGASALVKAGEHMLKNNEESGKKYVLAGSVLGGLIGAVQNLTTQGIQFMMGQTTKMIDGFKQMSSAGAMYSEGMVGPGGMIDTASKAGLTLEQFGKAVSGNTELIAKAGMGVTEGSKRMAQAMASGGTEARKGMFGLGMTMEEQADAYAITMQRMAGPMGKLNSSNAEVAQQTAQYARDLKLISDLTGKSAKAQQDQAEAAVASMRMQQEIAGLAPTVRANFQAALGAMDSESTKAMQDRIAHMGQVTDKTTAILEAQSPALRAQHEEEFRLFKAGKLTAEAETRIRAKYAEQVNKELSSKKALGTAADSEMAQRGGDLMKENAKFAAANTEEAKARIKKLEEDGKAGKSDAGKLLEAQQNFQIEAQKIATKNLGEFSKALDSTIKAMTTAVEVLGHGGGWLANMMSGWGGLIASTIGSVLMSYLQIKFAARGVGKIASTAGEVASTGAKKASEGIGGGLSSLGKGVGDLGKGAGAGAGGFLEGLANGLKAFGNGPTILGLAAVTAAVIGFGYALRIAAPALEPFGKMMKSAFEGIGTVLLSVGSVIKDIGTSVSTVITGIATSMAMMSKDVDPLRLLQLVPGIAGIGAALIPFGIGGALAGLLGGKTGGFDAVANGLKKFEELSPEKLNAVAASMKNINANMPSVTDLAKLAVSGVFDKLSGKTTDTSTTTATAPQSTDLLSAVNNLVKVNTEQLAQQKEMIMYMRDHGDTSRKILRASQ